MSNPVRSTGALAGNPRPAQVNVTFPKMDIFVRFEIWNVTTKRFEPVRNLPVDLMDSNRVVSNTLLETRTTDANGFISLSMTKANLQQKSGEDRPDLYFNARPKGLTCGGMWLPDEWSTKAWKDKNGKPGFFPDTDFVAGGSLGGASAADPLVYRIGLDYHARFMFVGPGNSDLHRAPKGLLVRLHATHDIENVKWERTDKNGEVHGLSFDAQGGVDLFFQVKFNIADPDINLPVSTVETDAGGAWYTDDPDADKKFFPDNASTSLGTQNLPEWFPCANEERNVALFFLTMLYEHATFFFHITDGAWTGVPNLEMNTHGLGDSAYSWPVGVVHITKDWWASRATVIHELSHQVMWKEVGISSLDIAGQVIDPHGLCLRHYDELVSNWTHAVIEGWAEIFEGLFEPGSSSFTSSSTVKDGDHYVPLGPTPPNFGLKVEGAFSQAVISVFQSFVTGPVLSNASVGRSFNGDVTETAPWIKDPGVKQRFKSAVWGPLHALRSSEPWTYDFISKMQDLNPADWPNIVTKLNAFNIAMDAPQIESIQPASGPSTGNQPITIKGSFFHLGSTQVTIGGKAVTGMGSVAGDQNMHGDNETTITCRTPPGSSGKVDVVVTTSAGTTTLEKGYEYISVLPTISSVVPASGLIAGGELIKIYGSNFDRDNTQVKIGGRAVTQFLSGLGDDPATTLSCQTPSGSGGKVDIVVTTAAGSVTLSAGYEYKYPTSSLDAGS